MLNCTRHNLKVKIWPAGLCVLTPWMVTRTKYIHLSSWTCWGHLQSFTPVLMLPYSLSLHLRGQCFRVRLNCNKATIPLCRNDMCTSVWRTQFEAWCIHYCNTTLDLAKKNICIDLQQCDSQAVQFHSQFNVSLFLFLMWPPVTMFPLLQFSFVVLCCAYTEVWKM